MSSGNVIIKINHFDAEGRSVKMETRNILILIFLSALVATIDGFGKNPRFERGPPTAEDCMKPPMTKFGHECCRVPKERIWGDLRPSMESCFRKMKQEGKPMRQETPDGQQTPETVDMMTPTEDPSGSGMFPSTSPSTTESHGRRKKPLSERLKDLFSTVYKEIKNTINSIWQSVVIITDHFRRRGYDACFMECVFQDQGFLMENLVNKAAVLARFDTTLGQNEEWHKVVVGALETCYQRLMEVPSNNTCHSGSEEIFRCVFKQIFFNCPNWTQSEYCTSLKEFYQKCPDGPPPEINDNHSTSPAPPPSVEEVTEDAGASAETESSTQSE